MGNEGVTKGKKTLVKSKHVFLARYAQLKSSSLNPCNWMERKKNGFYINCVKFPRVEIAIPEGAIWLRRTFSSRIWSPRWISLTFWAHFSSIVASFHALYYLITVFDSLKIWPNIRWKGFKNILRTIKRKIGSLMVQTSTKLTLKIDAKMFAKMK